MESPTNDREEREKQTPGRSRGKDLVEEARIAKARGGVPGISSLYQALLYLVLLAALIGALWWALRD
jgi:hypothetical protein